MRNRLPVLVSIAAAAVAVAVACGLRGDPQLAGSSRGQATGGWIPVRLQGSPARIGYQHGCLLAPEIADALEVMRLSLPHDTGRDWAQLRTIAEKVLWPHVDEEYRRENVTLDRTRDGYFVGANFPINSKLIAEETDFKADAATEGTLVRRARWEQLMAERKGTIDVAVGKAFLADHYDAYEKKADSPSERTLCGHVELSPRGMKPWQDEFGPAGTVQAKVTDAAMGQRMEMEAALGHPCGLRFKAADYLKGYPQFAWQKGLLRDLPSGPWTRFAAR